MEVVEQELLNLQLLVVNQEIEDQIQVLVQLHQQVVVEVLNKVQQLLQNLFHQEDLVVEEVIIVDQQE